VAREVWIDDDDHCFIYRDEDHEYMKKRRVGSARTRELCCEEGKETWEEKGAFYRISGRCL
jgi:hypothetical protein